MVVVVMAGGSHTLFIYRSIGELEQNDGSLRAGGCLQKPPVCLLMVVNVVVVEHRQRSENWPWKIRKKKCFFLSFQIQCKYFKAIKQL